MKVIGLTGGIASGKSTVSALLKKYGFAVIDADIASREAVAPGSAGLQQVREAFGEQAVIDGEMNRAYVGQLVFNDKEKREILNHIIHPIVRELMEQQKQQALLAGQHVIMDIPLLFENGLEHTVDEVWVVFVPQSVQLTRLMERNQLTEEEAVARINSQLPIEEKKQRADRVIDNSGTLQQLEMQVKRLTEEFFRNNLKIEKI